MGGAKSARVSRFAEAEWPTAEFIVGNPPFLGGKLLRSGLGDDYVETLFTLYDGRVPREADLVTYWFEKSRKEIADARTKSAGLVSTNSIRGGANRKVLERVMIVEGAAVRVSLVCFHRAASLEIAPLVGARLDGVPVPVIFADLTASGSDLTRAKRLKENQNIAFMGDTKGGAFDIGGDIARDWLREPLNPNGRPNSDVLKPWINGFDITRRARDMWIIDFGWTMTEAEAALYQEPFNHAHENIRVARQNNNRESYARYWWRHVEPRPAMWKILNQLAKYVATPRVAKHRTFSFYSSFVVPDSRIFAFAKGDSTFFGILQSSFHESWTLGTCSWHGVGNDPTYNSEGVFETFPFPEGLTPNIAMISYENDPRAKRIAVAAEALDQMRRAWLNPPDLVEIIPEIVPTAALGEAPVKYPDRFLPRNVEAALRLKDRTLTKLYNERPQWLASLHEELDRAVAAAYGWPEDISTDDALAALLALNLERSAAGR